MKRKSGFVQTRVPVSQCLECHEPLDAASGTDPNGKMPKPGDISVCLRCGYLMAFKPNLKLRALTLVELQEVATDPHVQRVQALRREAMAKVFRRLNKKGQTN